MACVSWGENPKHIQPVCYMNNQQLYLTFARACRTSVDMPRVLWRRLPFLNCSKSSCHSVLLLLLIPHRAGLSNILLKLSCTSVFCSFVHVFLLLLITVSNSLLLMICCEHLYFFYLPCIPEDGLCFIDRLFTSVLNDVPSSTHVYR